LLIQALKDCSKKRLFGLQCFKMTSMTQYDECTAFLLEKVSCNDDAMSTVSGSSSDQLSSDRLSSPSSPFKAPEAPGSETGVEPPVTLADLPSLGSLGHFAGQCSRCCFFPKGRCLNGYDCRFCHFEHEKRHRKKKTNVRSMPSAHGSMQPFYQQYGQCQQYETLNPPGLGCAPRVVAPPATVAPAPSTALQGLVPPALAGPTFSVHGQPQSVECWSIEKVVEWLTLSGLGHLAQNFEEHRITGDILLDLTSNDLNEIGVHAFGDKKRFLRAACELRTPPLQAVPPPPPYPNPRNFQSDLRPCPPPLNACQSPFNSAVPTPYSISY